jgi:cellobiose-specific phosphotransferase system component IIB
MAYVTFNSVGAWTNGIHTGKYKNYKAFIEIINNRVQRIVLEDATHFFGESLAQIDFGELLIYVLVTPNEQETKKLQEKEAIIKAQFQRLNKYAEEEDNNIRLRRLAENTLHEKQHRHNAQLRSIFYMLEELSKVGTHHEKEVVIRYIRQCIYGFMKGDSLDQYGSVDDLPF